MASLESSPHPFVFKVKNSDELGFRAPAADGIALRTIARSLNDGMQKEAIVFYGPTNVAWRMVCDEGPYINGTDIAPFSIAFFTAGLAFSFMTEILALAKHRGIEIREIEFVQDNHYSMEGSATKGTMLANAQPVDLDVRIYANADMGTLHDLITSASIASPAGGLLRAALATEFTLTVNGENIPTGRVAAYPGKVGADPEACFDKAQPYLHPDIPNNINEKLAAAKSLFNIEGGAGSSLQSEQKRLVHVRGVCRLRPDGLKEVRVQLLKPLGSVFRFLSDDSEHMGGGGRAPSGLSYLSAGLAFCYMTQLRRYAHITKKTLGSHRIVQDTRFSPPGASATTGKVGRADRVVTHVHINTPEGPDFARTLVDMGYQTCFLQAVCRNVVKTRTRAHKPEDVTPPPS